jgi:hypothetical protein
MFRNDSIWSSNNKAEPDGFMLGVLLVDLEDEGDMFLRNSG